MKQSYISMDPSEDSIVEWLRGNTNSRNEDAIGNPNTVIASGIVDPFKNSDETQKQSNGIARRKRIVA